MASITVPVFDMQGRQTGEVNIDPAVLGGEVRPRLIKQAIVAYLDHQRQHSARTKGRSDVEGSTRKLYRQKGTGNARAGTRRTNIRRGGGVAFAKRGPRAYVRIPKKMRRLARNSAILAKLQSDDVLVLEDLVVEQPKTKPFAKMLTAIGAAPSCLVATQERDRNVFLSSRNLPETDLRLVEELHAYEVLRRCKLVITRAAFERLKANGGAGSSLA